MIYDQDIHYVEKVQAGDVAAFAFLVDKYRRMAITLSLRIVKSREEAEEVAQDAFIKAWRGIDKFKKGAKFTTWFYRIVVNESLTRTRKKKFEVAPVDDYIMDNYGGNFNDGIDTLNAESRKTWISKAMVALPEESALVIMLFYMEEQSIEEITHITGMTEENIKVRLHRGRKKLYSELERLLREEKEALV